MTTHHDTLWQTKLHARLHDSAETALSLLHDPAGHTGHHARVAARMACREGHAADAPIDNDNPDVLHAIAFPKGIQPATCQTVQRADRWAVGADRPQWPLGEVQTTASNSEKKTLGVAPWAQVRWVSQPVLIHPLTGAPYDLQAHGGLSQADFQHIKARALSHLSSLRLPEQGQIDLKRTLLALWRFGPELRQKEGSDKLGECWKLLPADTRVPDHAIWDHLDLTSAFAGAFAADPKGEAALLTLSIGPVQPFIAAARKMEDLWAGSHLLARLSWEAMRVVCEQLGPDAILFPRLRGVPQVDLWLRDQCGLPRKWFDDCDWMHGSTDSNPLFAAALPNRFVATVPATGATALAEKVQEQVRQWLQDKGQQLVRCLLSAAGIEANPGLPCFEQMQTQLQGFPEVHWAVVPFSLIDMADAQTHAGLDTTQLSDAMRPFFNGAPGQSSGFLASDAWKLLQRELKAQHDSGQAFTFYSPNPGVLYPAVHELAERALAAAKALRPFGQATQEGWRCTLSGEAEWLTTDRTQLTLSSGQRTDTLWTRLASAKPAWARHGEHLGALPALKRLWPTLFAEEVANATGTPSIERFVVSTHTMALAHQMKQWLQSDTPSASGLTELRDRYKSRIDPVALPRKLVLDHLALSGHALASAAAMPALLDLADEELTEAEGNTIRRVVGQTLASSDKHQTSDRLETYYALLLMDGDRMGAWLSGDKAIAYRDSFHPQVQKGFDERAKRNASLHAYGQQARALTPSRHLAISGALNDFSLTVVRHVVEVEHLGRLIYAGGDDVFAMLPVADLLPAMQRLRHAYSGHDPAHEGGRDPSGLTLQGGFARLHGKLMRMMGTQATASCGGVIAHHQAPLSAVRRELAAAEQRAKNEGGRDAFSITVVKRSGGTLRLTAKWDKARALLDDLRRFLARGDVSRRAAYHTLQWLDANELPQPLNQDMLQSLLSYQLARQAEGKARAESAGLAQRLVDLCMKQPGLKQIEWLRNFISVAEFLAREVRSTPEDSAHSTPEASP
ncbi:MAG: type III-B CRISPR-associated protein Cas10/Cmr2 [Pseudomonadota bacterium]|nr:type III-B CRISPR-associated protein Cas10/Cmr2 [Pseudomonadota bacterium]